MSNAYVPVRLILVRHGETAANIEGRMQGRGNDPLTERGRQQATAVAARLSREFAPIDAIYTSPLIRARTTAETIGAQVGITPRLRDGLQEMHLGELDGVSASDLAGAMPKDIDTAYPGGETIRGFVERIMGTLYGIVAAHPGKTIVVVTHGGVIGTALAHWTHGHGGAWQEFVHDNCALSVVQFARGPQLLVTNDCTHLVM